MARAANNQNRTEIVRSIALVALIIVMDLSGFSGLANQDRLEDVPDYRGTNSTDSDGDGVPDDEDDYPNDPYRVGPYQNEGIGHIILVSEGGQTGFNFDDVAITFVEYSSNIINISYLTDFDNLSVGTSVTDQYLSQGALYSVVLGGPVAGTIGDLVNGTHGISDFGSSLPNAAIVGGIHHAVRIDIIDPDTGLAETAARGIEMRLGDGDSGSESFRVEVYDHNGSILHNESFTTYGGAVNGGVNFSYWYPIVDSDGDGFPDEEDAFPNDPTAHTDTDLDGMPDSITTPSFMTDGLVGYWKLDEASGNVVDSSDNALTSTVQGNVTYNVPGEYGSAIKLDGHGEYIDVSSNDALNVSNITLSFWLNFSQFPPWTGEPVAGLICRGDTYTEQWCMDAVGNNIRFWHRHWGGDGLLGIHDVVSFPLSTTNEWIHIAATYNTSFSAIYLNGQLQDIENHTGSWEFGDLVDSEEPLYIGAKANSTGSVDRHINSAIDEVRIYDNGFNPSEVEYLYNLTRLVEDDDDDNDGTSDIDDAFPLDPTEDSDFDGNGVGDNAQFAEFDLDGDGVWDEVVNMPGFMRGLANTSTIVDYSMQSAGTCLILNNGSMMCWGTGIYANTGIGNGWQMRQTPAYATLPPGRTAVEVSMGMSQFCVLLDDNSVACWGRFWPAGFGAPGNSWGLAWELDTPTIVSTLPANAVSVSVADGFNQDTHTCSIMENGSVYCWGSNQNGQLGLGFRCVENNSESPIGNECHDGSAAGSNVGEHTYYIGNASQMILPEGRTAVGMHLGRHYSLIVLDNHSMICYGQNCGSSGDHENFVYVGGPHKITAVIASHTSGHSPRVLTSQGIVVTLDAYFLDVGLGPHTYNQQVGPFSEIGLNCASMKNGSVACNPLGTWVSHPPGSEALGHTGHWYTPPPNLSAGGVKTDHHKACAILSNGDLECWGYNGGPDGAGIGVDYYCDGENDSNGCDSANFVLSPRRIVLPRPLMVQEMDLDGDGISKLLDRCADGESGWTSNSSTDFDGDGCRDATEDDDDNGDGITDALDSDCDGIGDEADPDDDNDGIPDETDAFPYNPYEWSDMDNDGTGDNCDCDIDGDGVSNDIDAFPTDPSAHTDTDGDGMPDEITAITPNQQGIGHIILVSEGGQTGFNFDDVAITFVEYSSNISYLTDFDNLSVGTSVTDQYLSQGALYSAVNMDGSVEGTIGDLVNGTHGISDFGSSSPNAVIVGGLGAAVRIDIIDPDTGLAETAARGIEMRLGDGDSGSESFRVEVYDHNGSILHNESFTTYGGAVNGGVNFSYWYPSTTTNLTEDLDDDNDGTLDINDAFPLDPTEDIDTDGDGVGDNADDDDDGDGYSDLMDAFPLDSSEWLDSDGDFIGDNTDTDDDNDGSLDIDDAFPLDPSEDTDTDGDGVGDNADDDDDGDGYSDLMDAFPLDPSEWLDTDGDGVGNNADTNDDNDGSLDIDDAFPLDPSEDSDTDGDGVGDNADDDDDGDGVSDAMDAFPLDATEWYDTDLDGVGDNTDTDDDNDGSLDWDDAFPLDPSEDSDTDGDGVGDNADDDADDDGEVDNETALSIGPLNPSNSLKLSLLINLILVLLATLVISNRRSSSSSNLVGFEKMPEPQITTAVKDRKEVLEKYLSQGYSPELANTLADNEMRKN